MRVFQDERDVGDGALHERHQHPDAIAQGLQSPQPLRPAPHRLALSDGRHHVSDGLPGAAGSR